MPKPNDVPPADPDAPRNPPAAPLFGELLVELGVATRQQVVQALGHQQQTGQRVGEALVALGYATREQLESALLRTLGFDASRAAQPQVPLGEILLRLRHINEKQLEQALALQRETGRRLGAVLVSLGFCGYEQVYEALAMQQRLATSPTALATGAEPGALETPPPRERLRILLIHDSALVCSAIQGWLHERGFDVRVARDPFLGIDEVFHFKPSMLLVHMELPGLSGLELCRRVKGGPAQNTPIIVLSDHDRADDRVECLRAGADDCVPRSIGLEELLARIEAIARRAGEMGRVRRMFARYTSEAVVEEILKAGDVVLTGVKQEVTVLFADIRDFTSLTESLPAEEVGGLLNELLSGMSDSVLSCGGTLDKYLGDGLMAVFGAPVRHADHALRAVQAAKMMMARARDLNTRWERDFLEGRLDSRRPALELGLGINSGMAVVGSFGSPKRAEYTCIGDAVNVAARLCALAGRGEILVGGRTRELAAEGGPYEDMEPVRLKGKTRPVELFRAPW